MRGSICDYNGMPVDCCDGIQSVCDSMQDFYMFSTSSYTEKDATWFSFIILASFLGNMLLFFVILSDEKLQVHPMRLFAVVAFLDGSLFWLYLTEPHFCTFNKYNLFYAVTFPSELGANTESQF